MWENQLCGRNIDSVCGMNAFGFSPRRSVSGLAGERASFKSIQSDALFEEGSRVDEETPGETSIVQAWLANCGSCTCSLSYWKKTLDNPIEKFVSCSFES